MSFITSSRYGQLEVARAVGLYRKPFSLGRKSSARGRSIARSKKIQKFFSRKPLKPGSLRSGEFIEGMDLYKMASRQSPRVLTFTARGRQIFKEFEISAGPQHFVYNFLSVWTIGGRAGRRPLPEAVFVRSKIVR
jgi:hypothetical protein